LCGVKDREKRIADFESVTPSLTKIT